MKWFYVDRHNGELLDSWEGDVDTVLDHVNIGDGIWSLAMNNVWQDDNVIVYNNEYKEKVDRSTRALSGVCTCDSRDLFWLGCRCGFMRKA